MNRTRSNRICLKIAKVLQTIFGIIAMAAFIGIIGTVEAIGSAGFFWSWGIFLVSLTLCLGYSREYELLGGKYE